MNLKINKASGEDAIIAEMLKTGGMSLAHKIHMITEDIWIKEKIPADWKCALIHPLHKKGDKTDINNYKGISLLPINYKILSNALLMRLETQINHLIAEYQVGFRNGRSCAEQILNLKTILQILKNRRQ